MLVVVVDVEHYQRGDVLCEMIMSDDNNTSDMRIYRVIGDVREINEDRLENHKSATELELFKL
jgi:hypothetical protein